MKTSILFAAAAAILSLTSCNQEQVVSVNPGTSIAFRSLMDRGTRAADLTTASLQSFSVSAYDAGTLDEYFTDAVFTLDSQTSTFLSAKPYYWPATGSLDFYAYAPVNDTQVVKNGPTTFVLTPDGTADSDAQADLLFASTKAKSKALNAAGVPLNFRHAASKIVVKAKNTQTNLKFDITDMKIAYIAQSGTLEVSAEDTDTPSNPLEQSDWTPASGFGAGNCYIQACEQTIDASASAQTLGNSLILVPQTVQAAAKYGSDGMPNGAYIAIKAVVKNKTDDAVVFAGGDGNADWLVFPISVNWLPGMKYTYTVDLAGGGYKEEGDEDEDVDPILKDAQITFVNVSVDDWNSIE